MTKSEPWYIHAILYVVIIALAYILIQVAIVQPQEVMEKQAYWKKEGRLRMLNLRQAEILWEKRFGRFTDDLDSLITFIQTDSLVNATVQGVDSLTGKSTNPFYKLTSGEFAAESLRYAPKTNSHFMVQVDTTVTVDTTVDYRGRVTDVDTNYVIGQNYVIESPDSDDKIGDLYNQALRNTASWE